MTTYPLPTRPVKIAFPTREEWRQMLYTPSIVITIIVCVTLVALAVLAGVVFLAYTGNDAAVIGVVIGSVLTGVLSLQNARMRQVRDAVKEKSDVQS